MSWPLTEVPEVPPKSLERVEGCDILNMTSGISDSIFFYR